MAPGTDNTDSVVLVVLNKDGGKRFIVDYRRLNSIRRKRNVMR